MIMVLLADVISTDKILADVTIEIQVEEITVAEVEITVAELAVEEIIVVEVAMAVEEITTTVILRRGIRRGLRGLMRSIRLKG
jgi:hypothetical protein